MILHSGITAVGKHAFYGCADLTVYSDLSDAGELWDQYWNSSYRPTVWGCALSEDLDYILSFTGGAENIENKNSTNHLSAPEREGYTFVGWNTSSSATKAAYTMETLQDVPDGRRVYAIWDEISEEN